MIKIAASLYLMSQPIAVPASTCAIPENDAVAIIHQIGQRTGQINIRLTIAPQSGASASGGNRSAVSSAPAPYRRSVSRTSVSTIVIYYQ